MKQYKKIRLYHMRKTGGTSLRHYVKALAAQKGVEHDVLEGYSLDPESYFKDCDTTLFITSLREPIARIRSSYLFEGRWLQKDRERSIANAKPFDVWVDELNGKQKSNFLWKCVSNYYIKALIGFPVHGGEGIGKRELEHAKDVMRKFDILLITETMGNHDVAEYLSRTLGFETGLPFERKGPAFHEGEEELFPPDPLRKLCADNAPDIELYEYAQGLAEDRVRRAGLHGFGRKFVQERKIREPLSHLAEHRRDIRPHDSVVLDKHMQDGTLLERFTHHNRQHLRGLVYHLGNRGFFAELTTVARAMIYAEAHQCRLLLDSSEFTYGYQNGWSDYLEPFCEQYDGSAVDGDWDHCYSNKRGPGTMFNEVRSFQPRTFEFYGLVMQGFQRTLGEFVRAIFRLKQDILLDVSERAARIELPEAYAAVHIRRGDKVGDEDIYYPPGLYWRKLIELDACGLPLFVLSDDYEAVRELKKWLGTQGMANPVYTLCEEARAGFDIHVMRQGEACYASGSDKVLPGDTGFRQYMYRETLSLLAEVEIASRAKAFVGTKRSNVSKTIGYLQNGNRFILIRNSDARGYAA